MYTGTRLASVLRPAFDDQGGDSRSQGRRLQAQQPRCTLTRGSSPALTRRPEWQPARPTADGLVLYDAAADSAWGKPPAFLAGDAGLVSTPFAARTFPIL